MTVKAKPLKSYSPARLKVYGDMATLTAGGSGSAQEGTGDTALTRKL